MWMGLLLAIFFDTVCQTCWKLAVLKIPASASFWPVLGATLRQPMFYVTALTYLAAFANWMILLGNADLSFAAPIASLSYLTVTISSAVLLHEQVTVLRAGGMLLILAGAALIGSTDAQSDAGTSSPEPVSEGPS